MKLNTLGIAHQFLAARVPEGGLCIDGTMGRGKDTAFLCERVGPEGKVIAFDIQEEALASTDALLRERGLRERAELRLESHVHIGRCAAPGTVDAVVFNFGYLPGGDHKIFTHPDTSIQAIGKALCLLKEGGYGRQDKYAARLDRRERQHRVFRRRGRVHRERNTRFPQR